MEIVKVNLKKVKAEEDIDWLESVCCEKESQHYILRGNEEVNLFVHKFDGGYEDPELHLMVKTGWGGFKQFSIPLKDKKQLIKVIQAIK